MKSAISFATPGGERSASGGIARSCEPSGRSGAMHRKSFASSGTTLRHRSAFTSAPWTNTIGSPVPRSRYVIVPWGRETSCCWPSSVEIAIATLRSDGYATYSRYLTYRLYECQQHECPGSQRQAGRAVRGDAQGAGRRGAEAVRKARLRRRRHGGDRAPRGRDPGRALPPLQRQGGPVPRGGRAGGGGDDAQVGGGRARAPGSVGAAACRLGGVPGRLPRPGRAADHPAGRALGPGAEGVARDRIEVRAGAGAVRPGGR